ncbi:tigger transposable element-derived protein 4-like [Anneissia japonica]|uniref:tigger transposable element-derived protein 4-like n=1 Tax=Anneissia japonica TaxID=1529436 RepID=UPI0014259036|nr:tigger transposable element-derived protein 4-like [Anneissia japonica]
MATRKKSHFQGLVVVKRRKILTVKQKLEIIEALEHNRSAKEIADLFGISKLQIFRIAKQKKTLLTAWRNNKNPDQKKIRRRRYQDVEEGLLAWFHDSSHKKILPSRELLMKQACLIAKNIGRMDFKPSRFWLQNWAAVHKINLMRLPFENSLGFNSVDNSASSSHQPSLSIYEGTRNHTVPQINYYQDHSRQDINKNTQSAGYTTQENSNANQEVTMQSLLLKYEDNDIYFIGTVALYYRALPQKMSGCKYEATSAEKNPWEIISVVLATNMSGSDKTEVWVIGQDEGSRDCFKGINNIPVTYVSSEDTCMSPGIFTEWVQQFDESLSIQNRKVSLIVQLTAASSVNVSLKNINLIKLPQSETMAHPLDHGITAAFKKYYRRQIVERILLSMKSGGDMFSKAISQAIAYNVDLLDSAHMIHTAWKNVSQETIKKAFAKTGLGNHELQEDTLHTNANDEDITPEGMSSAEFSCYVAIDDNIGTVEVIGEDQTFNQNTSSQYESICLLPSDNNLQGVEEEFVDLVTNAEGESDREHRPRRSGRRLINNRHEAHQLRDHLEPASGEDVVESDASDGLNDYYGNSSLLKRTLVRRKSYTPINMSSEHQQGTSAGHVDYGHLSGTTAEDVNGVSSFVRQSGPNIASKVSPRKERADVSHVPSPTETLIALSTVRRYLEHIGHEQYDSFLKVESAVISHCTKDLR